MKPERLVTFGPGFEEEIDMESVSEDEDMVAAFGKNPSSPE